MIRLRKYDNSSALLAQTTTKRITVKLMKYIAALIAGVFIVAGLSACDGFGKPEPCTYENSVERAVSLPSGYSLGENIQKVDQYVDEDICKVTFTTTIDQLKQWRRDHSSDEQSERALARPDPNSTYNKPSWRIITTFTDGARIYFANSSIATYSQLKDDKEIVMNYTRINQ